MSNTQPDAETINSLLNFLDRADPKGRQKVDIELAKAGIAVGAQTASTEATELAPPPADAADALNRKKIALIGLAVAALTNVIDRFAPLRQKIQVQVRKVRRLNLVRAIITTALSSSVVASLGLGGQKIWTAVLGLAALGASLLTLVATWMEGEARLSEEFGEVNAKCEAAVHLRDRLNVYKTSPELFDDLDDRLKEANAMIDFLSDKIARWNVAITT